jgi:hypothetical protein
MNQGKRIALGPQENFCPLDLGVSTLSEKKDQEVYGVEQAFRPAVRSGTWTALAAEVRFDNFSSRDNK